MADRVNTQQMAIRLGCSDETVRRLAKAGKIPAIKLGRERRYDPEAVVKALTPKPKKSSRG